MVKIEAMDPALGPWENNALVLKVGNSGFTMILFQHDLKQRLFTMILFMVMRNLIIHNLYEICMNESREFNIIGSIMISQKPAWLLGSMV